MSVFGAIALELPDGRGARIGLGPDATTVAVGDEDVSCYDLAGRPYALVRCGTTWRRCLDGRWLEKRPAAGGVARLRRRLPAEGGAAVLEAARRDARALLALVASPAVSSDPARRDAARRLSRIVSMDALALGEDAARFATLCRPTGVLPPDQYLSLVVQVTNGCSWSRCTFCEIARGVPFRVKSVDELRAHAARLRDYFGEAIRLRRGIFIGDANALCVGHERLFPLLEAAVAEFPALAGRGLYAFVDVVSGRRKSTRHYRAYARLGLKRVYLGLESGDLELLRWLDKPGSPDEAVELVETLHESGISVGVVVLVGAGGRRFASSHARRTAEALTRLRLGSRDIVYFSEIVEQPGLEYARRMASEGMEPLAPAELEEQRRAIVAGFRPGDPARPPRKTTYDIREFVY